jgi:hypothetical protein
LVENHSGALHLVRWGPGRTRHRSRKSTGGRHADSCFSPAARTY